MNRAIAFGRARIPLLQRLLESSPTVVARDGKWIMEALDHEELSIEDCEMAMREHGIAEVARSSSPCSRRTA